MDGDLVPHPSHASRLCTTVSRPPAPAGGKIGGHTWEFPTCELVKMIQLRTKPADLNGKFPYLRHHFDYLPGEEFNDAVNAALRKWKYNSIPTPTSSTDRRDRYAYVENVLNLAFDCARKAWKDVGKSENEFLHPNLQIHDKRMRGRVDADSREMVPDFGGCNNFFPGLDANAKVSDTLHHRMTWSYAWYN
ncbi:hypothetical protein FISHEDRAFT_69700 [Fistulina hepatica ATCC 64428]|uniref:Uncharacterized protein n=1 Tax=Fistulina hepatica ATCC 64428 TaxID=1128425 RepID=A0A0D7ALG5_9AGAR|nr:hypothetical protein FISHEDRAFT_69700 [Fistulina hepatica ATCC 64428]